MTESLIAHESALRIGIFLAAFTVLAAWEIAAPRRVPRLPKARRWRANLGILIVNTALIRIAFPSAAVGFAFIAERQGSGLLHASDLPPLLAFVVALIALDLVIYLQHVVFHAVPVLWRLHRSHHADPDIDVTTGTRVHPIEMLISMAVKAAAIFMIGAPVLAVFVFEVALNVTSMFNHANVRMPSRLDTMLRLFVVTPDMHRVHHSIRDEEANCNFGFNLPWWDYLCGTYKASPRGGHDDMVIGTLAVRDTERSITLAGIISIPFLNRGDDRTVRPDDLPDPSQRAS